MAVYVEEFLWRGRPPGSKQPSAYHVLLGQTDTDEFGRARVTVSDPMTPAQAEQFGFPLSAIVDTINAEALKERDAAIAEKEEAELTLQAAVNAHAEAEQAKVAAEAERDAAIAEKEAALLELSAKEV